MISTPTKLFIIFLRHDLLGTGPRMRPSQRWNAFAFDHEAVFLQVQPSKHKLVKCKGIEVVWA
jgi:hypothetical protein